MIATSSKIQYTRKEETNENAQRQLKQSNFAEYKTADLRLLPPLEKVHITGWQPTMAYYTNNHIDKKVSIQHRKKTVTTFSA